MTYVKTEKGQPVRYPYGIDDLRRDNPQTGFPSDMPKATLRRFGLEPVVKEPAPQHDPLTQRATQWSMPRKKTRTVVVDGEEKQVTERGWVLGWDVKNLTKGQAARNVRQERENLLLASDWTQVADAPVDQAAWAHYRQALRDVPDQAGFPFSVEWPARPE